MMLCEQNDMVIVGECDDGGSDQRAVVQIEWRLLMGEDETVCLAFLVVVLAQIEVREVDESVRRDDRLRGAVALGERSAQNRMSCDKILDAAREHVSIKRPSPQQPQINIVQRAWPGTALDKPEALLARGKWRRAVLGCRSLRNWLGQVKSPLLQDSD